MFLVFNRSIMIIKSLVARKSTSMRHFETEVYECYNTLRFCCLQFNFKCLLVKNKYHTVYSVVLQRSTYYYYYFLVVHVCLSVYLPNYLSNAYVEPPQNWQVFKRKKLPRNRSIRLRARTHTHTHIHTHAHTDRHRSHTYNTSIFASEVKNRTYWTLFWNLAVRQFL